MSSPGEQEPLPGSQPLAVEELFGDMIQEADGDIGKAINSVTAPATGWAFIVGYMKYLSKTRDIYPQEAHKHAISGIYGQLFETYGSDPALLLEKQALWRPVISTANAYGELGASWEKMRTHVHDFDAMEGYSAMPAVAGGGGADRPDILGREHQHHSDLDVRGAVHFFDSADEVLLRG